MGDNLNDKIQELIDKLNYYTKLYDEGHPQISDKEWDDMYFKLVDLESKSGIYLSDSPTQTINYQVVNKLNKVKHNHPMLSLDKTKSIDAIKSFLGNKDFICMAKMDGLTCSLRYLDGKLVSAETRGNGIEGEDILHNALQVKNIPNKINYKEELIIDGEIICTYNDFKNFEKEYKNPRNFASGSIRLLDSKESSMRNLTFIVWDIIKGLDEDRLSSKLLKADELGFTIVPFEVNLPEYETIEQIMEIVKKSSSIYPIDGLVFKYDNCDEYIAAGRTDHHFKGGLAYKFYDDEYETTLKDIEWTMGRTGVLTPVAVYEDIEIDGSVCNRASLHNISIMKELSDKIRKGDKLMIYKANQIIPQIASIEFLPTSSSEIMEIPKTCPICGGDTSIHRNNDSEVLYCDNPNCSGKLLNRFKHFVGKKGLDIKGISEATLEKLMDWGWINTYQDIFLLWQVRDKWIQKPGFGEASVDKILNAIAKVKENVKLEQIIAAAGIPEIGSRVAKDLAKHYNSWADFRAETNFLQYDGIGEVMNNNLLNFNYEEIDEIVKKYLIFEKNNDIINIEKENKLNDLTFVITGKLHNYKNRDELVSIIETNGGKVVGSVTKNTNYLINNDINSNSSKNIKAKQLNIPILTEEEFIKMI